MYRGVEMMTTGETTDSKGRKLFDTTFGEGLVKFLDSQPVRMAELSRARGMEYADIAIQRSKIDYYRKKWIKATRWVIHLILWPMMNGAMRLLISYLALQQVCIAVLR